MIRERLEIDLDMPYSSGNSKRFSAVQDYKPCYNKLSIISELDNINNLINNTDIWFKDQKKINIISYHISSLFKVNPWQSIFPP